MNSAIERLLSLRVADVMNKRVVSVSSTDTMAQAAETLLRNSISGAPILDERLRCTGMLTATDFVKKQAARNGELVCHHMTPTVHSIEASEPLLSAARLMCTHHIHRLPVLDENCRPTGIVTALDVGGCAWSMPWKNNGARQQPRPLPKFPRDTEARGLPFSSLRARPRRD